MPQMPKTHQSCVAGIAATLFLLVAGGTPAIAAKLRFDFLSSVTPVLSSPADSTAKPVRALTDGEQLNPEAVLALMDASDAKEGQSRTLFTSAVLLVQISDVDGNVLLRDVVGDCSALDLVYGEGLFAQTAECDDQTFGYSVSAAGISLLLNSEPFRDYMLEPGTYDINGVPVRVE